MYIRFHYMAVSDDRQRFMPMPEDRLNGQVLDYPEAVLLTRPSNRALKGEVRPILTFMKIALLLITVLVIFIFNNLKN